MYDRQLIIEDDTLQQLLRRHLKAESESEITATQECKFTSVIRYGNNSRTGIGTHIVISMFQHN